MRAARAPRVHHAAYRTGAAPALPIGERHAQSRGGVVRQATTSASAVSTRPTEEAATQSRAVESSEGSNREGRQEHDQSVRLNGGGEDGQPLEGRDEALEENRQWHATAFPSYMQSAKDDFCQNWDEALQEAERRQSSQKGTTPDAVTVSNPVWQAMRKEARRDAAEPLLSSFMYASILSHGSFLDCLAFVLANRLSDPAMLATEYFETFLTVFKENPKIVQAALEDIQAAFERDPACGSYSNALLFYKGYQAIQVHRIAHHLWNLEQKISARNLQSRVSQVFSVDIHPQARLGKGILMDHGTGIVIGQTAVIGNNVSILQNVTLGGTGKSDGDRHPKISDNVLIGAGATILGNITVGKGAMVASGSLVLKPVPPKTMVAGSPAKEVGTVTCNNPALKMQHWPTSSPEGSRQNDFCEPFEGLLQSRSQLAHDTSRPAGEASSSSNSSREAQAQPLAESSSSSDDEEPVEPSIEADAANLQPRHEATVEATSSSAEPAAVPTRHAAAINGHDVLSSAHSLNGSGAARQGQKAHSSHHPEAHSSQEAAVNAAKPQKSDRVEPPNQPVESRPKAAAEQRQSRPAASKAMAKKPQPEQPEPEYYL